MSLYFYLNIAIIAFPLIFSFEKRMIKYYTKIRPLIIAIFLVGIYFVGWDVFATYRGHWSFNPIYVYDFKIFGLPFEEILFFITVPYSCLFVFESIIHFIGEKQFFKPNKIVFLAIGVIIILAAFAIFNKEYTFLAIISVGLTIIFGSLLNSKFFSSSSYWIYIVLTLLLFLIFNYILTSLPVVQYSPNAITGFRFITIPIEDFLFNFSMLTNYLLLYKWALEKLKK